MNLRHSHVGKTGLVPRQWGEPFFHLIHVVAKPECRLYDSAVPNHTLGEWARICRTQAAWTTDPPTKAFLVELAAEYEALASEAGEPLPTTEPLQPVRAPRRR